MFICETLLNDTQIKKPDSIPASEFFDNSYPIYYQLPVKFNEDFQISNMDGNCQNCNKKIIDDNFRGMLTIKKSVCYLLGVGFCENCEIFTFFRVNFYQNQTVIHVNADGTLHYGKFQKTPSWLMSFLKWFK